VKLVLDPNQDFSTEVVKFLPRPVLEWVPNNNIIDMTVIFENQIKQTQEFFKGKANELESMNVFPGTKYLTRLLYFTKMVKTNAPYDLKNKGYGREKIGLYSLFKGQKFRFDDYGNYNYGVAARAYGISLSDAIFGAGLNQVWNGRGDITNPEGMFDDPRDTQMIINGYLGTK